MDQRHVIALMKWNKTLALLFDSLRLFLYTDHFTLKHLNSQDKLPYRHAIWIAFLQLFTYIVNDTFGEFNKVVDAFS